MVGIKTGVTSPRANAVGNIVLLTSASNIAILDKAPGDYLTDIIGRDGRESVLERCASNLVPELALDAALQNDYEGFLRIRSEYLHSIAKSLMVTDQTGTAVPATTSELDEPDGSDLDPTE